jgi:hypothetical protein
LNEKRQAGRPAFLVALFSETRYTLPKGMYAREKYNPYREIFRKKGVV